MSRKVYEEPAFPTHGTMGEVVNEGMSLRDYFAGKAMQGECSRTMVYESEFPVLAAAAYKIADAMLVARGAA